ncbi:hypothetical protein [Actinomadura nitritigenes]|uniref:hypothetical protein n=1 Tax=Actinomadura nitritigenes TaxID=134602 RepID=UPI003D8A16BC
MDREGIIKMIEGRCAAVIGDEGTRRRELAAALLNDRVATPYIRRMIEAEGEAKPYRRILTRQRNDGLALDESLRAERQNCLTILTKDGEPSHGDGVDAAIAYAQRAGCRAFLSWSASIEGRLDHVDAQS